MTDLDRIRPALSRLPIFPLPGAVLLPHALVPLHIFEPRYRKMIRDVADGNGVLALASIPPDALRERNEAPRVIPTIGVGLLAHFEPLPDGRSNIVLRGVARARIAEELATDEPYRIVRAEVIAHDPSELAAREVAAEAEELRELVLALGAARPGQATSSLIAAVARAADAADLADHVLAAVLETPEQRQKALETTRVRERLQQANDAVAQALVALASASGSSGGMVH